MLPLTDGFPSTRIRPESFALGLAQQFSAIGYEVNADRQLRSSSEPPRQEICPKDARVRLRRGWAPDM